MSKSIGNSVVWEMPLPELAERWIKRHPDLARQQRLTKQILTEELEQRTALALRRTGLGPAARIETPRQWEYGWNAEISQRNLRHGFQKVGWMVKVLEGSNLNPQDLGQGLGDEENCALVLTSTAGERAASLRESGLDLPFGEADAVVLMMAEELYLAAVDESKLKFHAPIIEEAAPWVFAQTVLGLPFSPWAQHLT